MKISLIEEQYYFYLKNLKYFCAKRDAFDYYQWKNRIPDWYYEIGKIWI